jgi:hypothetical protein
LLGTIVFALAVVRMVTVGVDGLAIAVASTAAAWVFAGGAAHRGSLLALSLCAAFDVALAILLLAPIPEVMAFLSPMLAKVSAKQFELAKIVAVGVAAIAAVECFVAVPQARAFAKWRNDRAHASPRFSMI